MKTKQDNDVTDCIGVVYTENKTRLLWPIRLGAICDENHTGQRHDWSYRSSLCQNDIELLGLILLGVVYDENYTG